MSLPRAKRQRLAGRRAKSWYNPPLSTLWWEKSYDDMDDREQKQFVKMMTKSGKSKEFVFHKEVPDQLHYETETKVDQLVYFDWDQGCEVKIIHGECDRDAWEWRCPIMNGPKWYQRIDPSLEFVTYISYRQRNRPSDCTWPRYIAWKREVKMKQRWGRLAFFVKTVGPALREVLEEVRIKPGGTAFMAAKQSFQGGVQQQIAAM
jgi:hypothetical protein